MSDNRIWRIRFTKDVVNGRKDQFWFQTEAGDFDQRKEVGKWQADAVRFTSFTTKEAEDVDWKKTTEPRTDPFDTSPTGGDEWKFECVGRSIPLAD